MDDVGSIEPGKKADLAIVNLNHPKLLPVITHGIFVNLLPNLIYSAHGDVVDTVIIDGRIVMQNKVIKTIDEAKALEQAARSAETLLGKLDQLVGKLEQLDYFIIRAVVSEICVIEYLVGVLWCLCMLGPRRGIRVAHRDERHIVFYFGPLGSSWRQS